MDYCLVGLLLELICSLSAVSYYTGNDPNKIITYLRWMLPMKITYRR